MPSPESFCVSHVHVGQQVSGVTGMAVVLWQVNPSFAQLRSTHVAAATAAEHCHVSDQVIGLVVELLLMKASCGLMVMSTGGYGCSVTPQVPYVSELMPA